MQIPIDLIKGRLIGYIRIEIPPTVLLLHLLQASHVGTANNLQPVIFDLNPN
jgi:hypothetical protein